MSTLAKTSPHARSYAHTYAQAMFVSFPSAADSDFGIRRHCLRGMRERKSQFMAERSLGTLFMSSIWSETIFKPRSIIVRVLCDTAGKASVDDDGGGGVKLASICRFYFISICYFIAEVISIQRLLMITCNLIITVLSFCQRAIFQRVHCSWPRFHRRPYMCGIVSAEELQPIDIIKNYFWC